MGTTMKKMRKKIRKKMRKKDEKKEKKNKDKEDKEKEKEKKEKAKEKAEKRKIKKMKRKLKLEILQDEAKDCKKRDGGEKMCCVEDIAEKTKMCKDEKDVGCVIRSYSYAKGWCKSGQFDDEMQV